MRRGILPIVAIMLLVVIVGIVIAMPDARDRSVWSAWLIDAPLLLLLGIALLMLLGFAVYVVSRRSTTAAELPPWLQGMQPPAPAGGPLLERLRETELAVEAGTGNLEFARQLMRQGNLASGLAEYEALIAASRELRAVIADLEPVLAVHPESVRLRGALANAYHRDGQFDRAAELFRR